MVGPTEFLSYTGSYFELCLRTKPLLHTMFVVCSAEGKLSMFDAI